jgi:hypothetical protein
VSRVERLAPRVSRECSPLDRKSQTGSLNAILGFLRHNHGLSCTRPNTVIQQDQEDPYRQESLAGTDSDPTTLSRKRKRSTAAAQLERMDGKFCEEGDTPLDLRAVDDTFTGWELVRSYCQAPRTRPSARMFDHTFKCYEIKSS